MVKMPFEKKKPLSQEEIEKLIDKGAPTKEDVKNIDDDSIKWTNINLRITTKMLDQIDEILKERVGISRTAWILESIQEKLKKDLNF